MGSDPHMADWEQATSRYPPLLGTLRRLAKDFRDNSDLILDPAAKDAWRAASKAVDAIVAEETKLEAI